MRESAPRNDELLSAANFFVERLEFEEIEKVANETIWRLQKLRYPIMEYSKSLHIHNKKFD